MADILAYAERAVDYIHDAGTPRFYDLKMDSGLNTGFRVGDYRARLPFDRQVGSTLSVMAGAEYWYHGGVSSFYPVINLIDSDDSDREWFRVSIARTYPEPPELRFDVWDGEAWCRCFTMLSADLRLWVGDLYITLTIEADGSWFLWEGNAYSPTYQPQVLASGTADVVVAAARDKVNQVQVNGDAYSNLANYIEYIGPFMVAGFDLSHHYAMDIGSPTWLNASQDAASLQAWEKADPVNGGTDSAIKRRLNDENTNFNSENSDYYGEEAIVTASAAGEEESFVTKSLSIDPTHKVECLYIGGVMATQSGGALGRVGVNYVGTSQSYRLATTDTLPLSNWTQPTQVQVSISTNPETALPFEVADIDNRDCYSLVAVA